MIHINLSQCLPATMTLADTRKSTAPNFKPTTDRDRMLEGRAHLAASQGIHVPLIGQRHFPEADAQIDQAEGAFFTGRVA